MFKIQTALTDLSTYTYLIHAVFSKWFIVHLCLHCRDVGCVFISTCVCRSLLYQFVFLYLWEMFRDNHDISRGVQQDEQLLLSTLKYCYYCSLSTSWFGHWFDRDILDVIIIKLDYLFTFFKSNLVVCRFEDLIILKYSLSRIL